MMDISDVYEWLDPDHWAQAMMKTQKGRRWQFGGTSSEGQTMKFWYMDLMDEPLFTETILGKIRRETQVDWILDRVYANGQTHGLSGSIHQDVENGEPGKHYTLLYYPNSEWNPEWGGYTVFTTTDGVITRYPTPNSMVFFDSTIPHAGLEPTRHCPELRVTIAFKLSRP